MKNSGLFVKIKQKIAFLYKNNKKLFILFLCLILVCSIYLFSSKKNKNETKNETITSVETISVNEYETILENKIKNILLSLDSISSVSVMVVCDSTIENVYLKDISQSTTESDNSKTQTITEEVVFEKNNSNSLPVVVSSKMPKVSGVLISLKSCSPSTKLSIINSISSVLNIDATCINILQES